LRARRERLSILAVHRRRPVVFALAGACLALVFARGADNPQVTDWKQKAAAGDPVAEVKLGEDYTYARDGLTCDYAQAMTLFQKAAAQNNAEAEADIGWLYEDGLGVPKDAAQAFQWFTKGANGGNAYGQDQLGFCYETGFGTPKDAAQAIAWYTKAAPQGNDDAMTRLGIALQEGRGVPKDLRQSFTYFLSAAYDNYGWAQYNVARCYIMGIFVPKDLTQAQRWCLLSVKNGYRQASSLDLLFSLCTQLTPTQFGDAQTLVKNWEQERMGDIQPATPAIAFAANQRAVIPLQDVYNELVVTATINGHPNLNFVIDTGCPYSLIDEKTVAAIDLSADTTYRPGGGIGPDRVLMPRVNHVDLQLPGVTFSGINFYQISTPDMDAASGTHIDGFLGSDLLKHLVMRIDYVHHTVELVDPAAFKPAPDTGAALPVTSQVSCVYLTGIVGNKGAFSSPTHFLVDTGNDGAINLTLNFADANPALDLKGGAASLVGGIGGTLATSTVKISQLKLGDITVDNPVAEISGANQGLLTAIDGLIGNEILRRFDVTLDYPGNRIFLKPNTQFNEPFIYANSGLDVSATGPDFRTYLVHDVTPGTAGARAGFQAGDILTQFDNVVLATQNDRQARLLFRQPGKHRIIVTRDGKPVTLDFNCDYIEAPKTGT
jgi:TPR repeat protein